MLTPFVWCGVARHLANLLGGESVSWAETAQDLSSILYLERFFFESFNFCLNSPSVLLQNVDGFFYALEFFRVSFAELLKLGKDSDVVTD